MEDSYCNRKEMEDFLSVVDVYDSAALIGKDFEYLIEQYGVEAVTDLMPKVIRVLEQLEYLAGKNEKENEELLQLESTIQRLHSDKQDRIKERQKYEQVHSRLAMMVVMLNKMCRCSLVLAYWSVRWKFSLVHGFIMCRCSSVMEY